MGIAMDGLLSEADHRHQCEVHHLITQSKKQGRQRVVDYLEHKNVAPRAARLRQDLNEQIKAGNTGKAGEWIERGKG